MSAQVARAPEDVALADGVRAQDPRAFAALMRHYNRRLYRVARSLLRDSAEAEDALQESYLHAFRSMDKFRGEASLATWLTRIVANECTSRLRKQARRDNIVPIVSVDPTLEEGQAMAEVPPTIDNDTPDRALVRTQMRELLERKIDQLPQDFRAVFMLRGVEELTVEETAACLGIPEATVRTRHFRARSLLREALAKEVDLAERDVFAFDGERCDRIVATVLKRAAG